MKANFFLAAIKFLKKDFNTSLSVGYISLVFIGMVFEGCLYRFFDINVIQYSDISDFLLAPFRNPKILIFVTLTIVVIYVIILLDSLWEKKHAQSYNWLLYFGVEPKKYKEWSSMQGMAILLTRCSSFLKTEHFLKL